LFGLISCRSSEYNPYRFAGGVVGVVGFAGGVVGVVGFTGGVVGVVGFTGGVVGLYGGRCSWVIFFTSLSLNLNRTNN